MNGGPECGDRRGPGGSVWAEAGRPGLNTADNDFRYLATTSFARTGQPGMGKRAPAKMGR